MWKLLAFFVLTVIVFDCCEAQMTTTTSTTTTTAAPSTNIFQNVSVTPSQVINFTIPGARLLGLLSLFTSLSNKFGGQGFVGRCFGAVKQVKMLIPFVLYKLGVITTTLGFLVLFTLKGLAIGVILLIINAGGWLAKIGFAKGQIHGGGGWGGQGHGGWSGKQGPPVHIHVHKDRNDHHASHNHDDYISYSPPPGYGSSYDGYSESGIGGGGGNGPYGSAKHVGGHGSGPYGPYGRGHMAIGTSSGPDYEPSSQHSWADRLSKGFNVGDLIGGELKRNGHAIAFPNRVTPSVTPDPVHPIR